MIKLDSEFYGKIVRENSDLSLREVVLLTLRKAILTGRLKPGERLMEIQLSQLLGVSRTPVRDAIRNLEQEGLVQMSPHRGAHVAYISEKTVIDVLEVRRAMEGLSVSRAVRRMTPEQLILLQEAMLECERATQSGDCQQVVKADVRFHDIILDSTGNEKLKNIMNNLSDQIYRYRYEFIKDAGNYSAMLAEHRKIYDAMSSRDEDSAVNAIQVHIDNQAEAIIRSLR